MSFLKATIVGNLGRDPELRYTPDGKAVTTVSIAANEKRKNKESGEMEDLTTWVRATLWGKQAETAAEHLQKGRQVYLEGRLRQETYTDKDGKERTSLELTVQDMQFIGGSKSEGGEGTVPGGAQGAAAAAAAAGAATGGGKKAADDDIPF